MRYEEFTTEEERMDEILPLIPAIAGGVARAAVGGVGRLAGKAALGLGKAAARGVGKAAKTIGKAAVAPIFNRKKDDEPEQTNPNDTVGTQPTTQEPAIPAQNTGAAPATKGAEPMEPQKLIKGKDVELPTKTQGGLEKYTVTSTDGKTVTIKKKNAMKGEPELKYSKQDFDRMVSAK